MAVQGPEIEDVTLSAQADLSTKQFYLVKLGTAKDTCALVAATTDLIFGILQDKPTSGHGGVVRRRGKSKAVVDGTTNIAVGDYLGPNSSGKLVKKTSADDQVFAIANQAATGSADVIEVWILGSGHVKRTFN